MASIPKPGAYIFVFLDYEWAIKTRIAKTLSDTAETIDSEFVVATARFCETAQEGLWLETVPKAPFQGKVLIPWRYVLSIFVDPELKEPPRSIGFLKDDSK